MFRIMEPIQALMEQGRSITPFEEAIAGIGNLFSLAVQELVEGLEAGTEEGVRTAVEKFEEEARRATEASIKRQRLEAERSREAEEQREKEKRIEEEKRKQNESERNAKQKIRDEKTAFWTTPGQRPLAEPPILDWDWFFRDHIPSDLRYAALFPNDPEKRCRIKDLHGEKSALHEYSHCAALTRDSLQPSERQQFWAQLMKDLIEDWREVDMEFAETFYTAAPLAQFEFRRLDNDGKTTKLEKWIADGANVFAGEPQEVQAKYRHLIPAGFVEDPLATFSYLHQDGATDAIKQQMEQGNDVLIGWPKEVQDRYGYLRRFLPPTDTGSSTSPSNSARNRWQLPPTLICGWKNADAAQERGKTSTGDFPSVVTRLVRSHRNSLSPPASTVQSPNKTDV